MLPLVTKDVMYCAEFESFIDFGVWIKISKCFLCGKRN